MTHATYPSLKDRTVLITGGGSGIGADMVRHFARQGSKVGYVDIADEPSRALLDEVRGAGGTVHYEHADVRDIARLRQAIEAIRGALGPITVLINNAAHDQRHKFMDVTPEQFDDRVAVNFKHAYFAAQAVIPDMEAAGGGTIVNFGSSSWFVGSPDLSVYASMKAGTHGFTRQLAKEFGPKNIRVNCIVPGWVMTQRQIDLWLTPEAEADMLEKQCLKRRLMPDDIAKSVLFLASEESSGMTNQSIIVDNGWI